MSTPSSSNAAAPLLEFWFEFASTYSYPAAMRVESAALEAGVTLAWHPFLLGPIFSMQGWNDSPFNVYPAKGRYMWRDLARICAATGLPLRQPSQFPRNGLLAARIACAHAHAAWLPEFVRRVYSANFAEDLDIADPAVIQQVLHSLDLPASVLAAGQAPQAKAQLRAQTERAQALDLFGAPSFVVGNEVFWGNDRLEAALAWAQAANGDF
ncbi:2-hydroxychromene-2-carboxylate isomerase [Panacagrimonas sp.]|uniref:2-hydroxychromene-2-carboxylate isomerase n=1 Tax=Panacagrimonas sp. TaxID=2480088 RepID=UPI003B52CE9D